MGNFFKDRWRKVGGVTLVLACMAIFGDVWSHFVWDRFFIRVGDSMQIVTSNDGCVSWTGREAEDLELYCRQLVPKWKSFPAKVARRYPLPQSMRQWSIPYWLIASSLMLLSGFLMRKGGKRGV